MSEISNPRLVELLQVVALLGNSLTEDEFVAVKAAILKEVGIEVASSSQSVVLMGTA